MQFEANPIEFSLYPSNSRSISFSDSGIYTLPHPTKKDNFSQFDDEDDTSSSGSDIGDIDSDVLSENESQYIDYLIAVQKDEEIGILKDQLEELEDTRNFYTSEMRSEDHTEVKEEIAKIDAEIIRVKLEMQQLEEEISTMNNYNKTVYLNKADDDLADVKMSKNKTTPLQPEVNDDEIFTEYHAPPPEEPRQDISNKDANSATKQKTMQSNFKKSYKSILNFSLNIFKKF